MRHLWKTPEAFTVIRGSRPQDGADKGSAVLPVQPSGAGEGPRVGRVTLEGVGLSEDTARRLNVLEGAIEEVHQILQALIAQLRAQGIEVE